MTTFKIVDGDLVMNKSMNFEMVEGRDEIAQCLERTLTTNINEWFLNTFHGLDYDAIQGKGRSKQEVELAIRTAVLQEPRISEVLYIDVVIDRETRRAKVDLKVLDVNLSVIDLEEVISIG